MQGSDSDRLTKRGNHPITEPAVLKRVGAILELFSEDTPLITLNDLVRLLGISTPTAYRYVADLCDMGMLSRVSGCYTLGPKVLELGYLINKFDPILSASKALMSDLCTKSGCHVLFSKVYGQNLINIYYAKGSDLKDLNFVPGRKMPWFKGSQARSTLAYLDRRKLCRIYELNEGDSARDEVGADWDSFCKELAQIRRAGHYISRGELDEGVTGVAAPVFDEENEVLGSLVLAFPTAAPPWVREELIANVVMDHARKITEAIANLTIAENNVLTIKRE